MHSQPQNIIYYGPPGTGKTYALRDRALELLCTPDELQALCSEQDRQQRFEQLRAEDRVVMVTFHQSYEYEEFVEGIRPALRVVEAEGGSQLSYELRNGTFKRMALRAIQAARMDTIEPAVITFEDVWEQLSSSVQAGADQNPVIIKTPKATYKLSTLPYSSSLLGQNEDESKSKIYANKESCRALWNVRNTLRDQEYSYGRIRDLVADHTGTAGGGHHHINWPVFQELLKIEQNLSNNLSQDVHPPRTTTEPSSFEEALGGRWHKMQDQVDFDRAPAYVLMIDEINRGNIARILGELITLIEPSRRLGGSDPLLLRLTYSQELFGVPRNLHILGTMNTADRSIAALDAALRRRFTFEACMPNPELLQEHLSERMAPQDAELIASALGAMNERLSALLDEDHQIGHASWMSVRTLAEARAVMEHSIIPLLHDHMRGDWERVGLVLNCRYASKNPVQLLHNKHVPWLKASKSALADELNDFGEPRLIYKFNHELSTKAEDHVIRAAFRGLL